MTEKINTNMMVLKQSRKPPVAGDVFMLRMKTGRIVIGRVIRLDAKAFGTPDDTLLYFYRLLVNDPLEVRVPLAPDLLIPPMITNNVGWRRGYYVTFLNAPIEPGELLPVHCFERLSHRGTYCDEFANPLPNRSEPCGDFGLDSIHTIDYRLSEALGLPPPFTYD